MAILDRAILLERENITPPSLLLPFRLCVYVGHILVSHIATIIEREKVRSRGETASVSRPQPLATHSLTKRKKKTVQDKKPKKHLTRTQHQRKVNT